MSRFPFLPDSPASSPPPPHPSRISVFLEFPRISPPPPPPTILLLSLSLPPPLSFPRSFFLTPSRFFCRFFSSLSRPGRIFLVFRPLVPRLPPRASPLGFFSRSVREGRVPRNLSHPPPLPTTHRAPKESNKRTSLQLADATNCDKERIPAPGRPEGYL